MTKTARQILERVYNKGFNDRCQQEKYADIDSQFVVALSVEQALKELEAIIQQEIAKARIDAELVFAATLRAAGGEVTLSKKELMSSNDYRVTRYDNILDGSVTFQVETLKEHKEAEL